MFNKLVFKNLELKKLSTSLLVVASLLVAQVPFANHAEAAGADNAEKKKKRPTQLVGPRVGKKVQKAFEAYSADDIKGALAILLEIEASKPYDQAYVARMVAVMYATLGDNDQKTIEYLKKAIEPDLLNEVDQSESLKLLGDMQMQTKDYKGALKSFYAWMEFSGKEDGQTYVKIANAYYSLKQLDKVIEPADKAIAAFGDKPNQKIGRASCRERV